MKTKLTIIVQTYNREKGLVRNLKALNDQSDINFRVLIFCNGCNYDVRKLILNYPNLIDKTDIHVEKQNIGLVQARNKSVKFVKTEFFSRVDDDDFAELDYVKKINHDLNGGKDLVMISAKNISKEAKDNAVFSWGPWRYVIKVKDFIGFPETIPEDFLSNFYYLSNAKNISFNNVGIFLPSEGEFEKMYTFSEKYDEYAYYWFNKIKNKDAKMDFKVDFYWLPSFISKKMNSIGTFRSIEYFIAINKLISLRNKYDISESSDERKAISKEFRSVKKNYGIKNHFMTLLIWSKAYVFFTLKFLRSKSRNDGKKKHERN